MHVQYPEKYVSGINGATFVQLFFNLVNRK